MLCHFTEIKFHKKPCTLSSLKETERRGGGGEQKKEKNSWQYYFFKKDEEENLCVYMSM